MPSKAPDMIVEQNVIYTYFVHICVTYFCVAIYMYKQISALIVTYGVRLKEYCAVYYGINNCVYNNIVSHYTQLVHSTRTENRANCVRLLK